MRESELILLEVGGKVANHIRWEDRVGAERALRALRLDRDCGRNVG